jgi:[acyl-carrier-protein] S-malonyltransferase
MAEAQEAFAEALDAADLQDPSLPLYANIDGQRKTTAAEVRAALLAQITGAVRWTELVRNLLRDVPNTPCVECGPGKVLKGLLRRIDRDATCLGVENLASLEAALKKLGG